MPIMRMTAQVVLPVPDRPTTTELCCVEMSRRWSTLNLYVKLGMLSKMRSSPWPSNWSRNTCVALVPSMCLVYVSAVNSCCTFSTTSSGSSTGRPRRYIPAVLMCSSPNTFFTKYFDWSFAPMK